LPSISPCSSPKASPAPCASAVARLAVGDDVQIAVERAVVDALPLALLGIEPASLGVLDLVPAATGDDAEGERRDDGRSN
jgi:hypothetical protein